MLFQLIWIQPSVVPMLYLGKYYIKKIKKNMSARATITLRKKPNCAGHFPLAIRIIKERKAIYNYIGQYIPLNHWDKKNRVVRKSNPNASYLNSLLLARLGEINRTLLKMELEHKEFTLQQIKKELSTDTRIQGFKELAKAHLKELEENSKLSRLKSDQTRINHLYAYCGAKHLEFRDLDEEFLKGFCTYLKNDKNLSDRSVANNLVVIRTLFNRAIRMGIVDRQYYPFGKGRVQIKFPETRKIGLSPEEIRKLETIDTLTKYEKHAVNVWLLSFYFAGMRISDVLKLRWTDIRDGRLYYRMNKNSKQLSLIVPEKVNDILEDYKQDQRSDDDYILPELKMSLSQSPKDIFGRTRSANGALNKALRKAAKKAKIDKNLTMHIARHSFGQIAGDKISIQILQKLYRHSSVTTTMLYQSNFMTEETDKALETVINF